MNMCAFIYDKFYVYRHIVYVVFSDYVRFYIYI